MRRQMGVRGQIALPAIMVVGLVVLAAYVYVVRGGPSRRQRTYIESQGLVPPVLSGTLWDVYSFNPKSGKRGAALFVLRVDRGDQRSGNALAVTVLKQNDASYQRSGTGTYDEFQLRFSVEARDGGSASWMAAVEKVEQRTMRGNFTSVWAPMQFLAVRRGP